MLLLVYFTIWFVTDPQSPSLLLCQLIQRRRKHYECRNQGRFRRKLSLKEKIAYSCTDMAGNLLYVTISSYIMYFYADVFHIPPAGALGAGAILLVARFAAAVSAETEA